MFDIVVQLKKALATAARLPDKGKPDGAAHRARSQRFVGALARGFQDYFEGHDPPVRVFWSGNPENRADFNRKEFQYDIAVCEIGRALSASGRAMLSFVTKAHWLVESEFEHDSRAAIIDMSKLAVGDSENMLFIGPAVGPRDGYLAMLGQVAPHCHGQLYLAIVDHPSNWKKYPPNLELYGWVDNGWRLELPVAP